jgi:hypothetical protein
LKSAGERLTLTDIDSISAGEWLALTQCQQVNGCPSITVGWVVPPSPSGPPMMGHGMADPSQLDGWTDSGDIGVMSGRAEKRSCRE